MIIGITGTDVRRLGNGKTAYAVLLILRAHLKYQLPIYANLHLFETDYTFIEDAEDLFIINNGIILIDDIQRALLLSKRNNVKTLSQLWSGASRKDDEYIVYTSSRLIDNTEPCRVRMKGNFLYNETGVATLTHNGAMPPDNGRHA